MALLHYSITNGARQLSCPSWCVVYSGFWKNLVKSPHWGQWIFNWRKQTERRKLHYIVNCFICKLFEFMLFLSLSIHSFCICNLFYQHLTDHQQNVTFHLIVPFIVLIEVKVDFFSNVAIKYTLSEPVE